MAYAFRIGQAYEREYDLDYRITSVTSSVLDLHFRHDAAGNIDRLGADAGAAVAVEQYVYDTLYRLEEVQDDANDLLEGYSYDATGNRLSKLKPAGTESYTYPANSHRLANIAGTARDYDAVGNTIAMAVQSFTYGDNNRMTRYSGPGIGGGLIADYQHNGHGERVSKEIVGDMILHLYDESGRLLGEYEPPKTGSNAQVIREYVYTDELPLAILDPVPIGGSVYYIHADHLGTPRAVTSDNGAKRWGWQLQGNPFGEQSPDENPNNMGVAFTFNLRFPGQYYDVESGLHYNYFRDYEPGTGRCVQSDPIGLGGGMATYTYVNSDPINYIDLQGEKKSRPPICHNPRQCPDPPFDPTENWPMPSPQPGPKKSRKPRRPTCAESTQNLATCLACCSAIRGQAASGYGLGSVCGEQCYQKAGITQCDGGVGGGGVA